MTHIPELVVGVSGVRGRVGGGLTPEVMARLAAAHGAELLRRRRSENGRGGRALERRVVLGRDSRTSGPMLRDAAAAGLLSVGCDVLDLGLVPTPTVLLAVHLLGAAGGLVVTASHNPPEWNAAKLVSARGLFLTREEGIATLGLFDRGGPPRAAWDGLGTELSLESMIPRHVERILAAPAVDAAAVRARRFRLVLDVGGGVGGLLVGPLLEALGCRVDTLHGAPDGRFPRRPEPVPESLHGLGRRVRETGADLGFALDPDGDRLALVASDGRAVGEDFTLALAAERVLASEASPAGARPPVVTNLSTSRVVEQAAARAGAPLVRTPVGEIHVVERMLQLGSAVGGEGNGGVVLPDVHPTRDAAVAAALVLSLLATTGRTLDEAVAAYSRSVIVKETVKLEVAGAGPEPSGWAERFPGAMLDRQDGVRLAWDADGSWLHVRRSGTEPLVRIIAEAGSDADARALIERARAVLAGAVEASSAAAPEGS